MSAVQSDAMAVLSAVWVLLLCQLLASSSAQVRLIPSGVTHLRRFPDFRLVLFASRNDCVILFYCYNSVLPRALSVIAMLLDGDGCWLRKSQDDDGYDDDALGLHGGYKPDCHRQTWSLEVSRAVHVSIPTALFAPLVEIGVMFSLNLWNARIGDQAQCHLCSLRVLKSVAEAHSNRPLWKTVYFCQFVSNDLRAPTFPS